MMLRWRMLWMAGALVALAGCRNGSAPSRLSGPLEAGQVARVGDDSIPASAVRAVASARNLPVDRALDRLVSDALLAQGARARGFDRTAQMQVVIRGVLAQTVISRLQAQVSSAPSTADEIAKFTAEHWLDLDRPEAYRTVHAVVQVDNKADASRRKSALEVAKAIAVAVHGISEPDQFIARAQQVPSQGFQVVAQKLDPVTADGRVANLQNRPPPGSPAPTYAPEFAASVFTLRRVGEQTAPVLSSFGWHVIMLTEMQPAVHVALERRTEMLREEIVSARAKEALDKLTERLRVEHPVHVERNVESVMALLPSEPGSASGDGR